MNRKEQINNIFSLFKKHNPKPTTELKYNSNYELLIAVVLSAQATDVSVNKATDKLFIRANTPKKMIDMGLLQLESYIKSIGLYKNKAKNIISLSEILIEKYKSEVPNSYEELISLPGVGRKTANVILNTLFGKLTIAVDTHIFRVSNRLGFAKGKTPLEVEEKLQKVIPKKYKHDAHHWLILHGRYVCKARVPDCENCFINKYCDYYKKLMSER